MLLNRTTQHRPHLLANIDDSILQSSSFAPLPPSPLRPFSLRPAAATTNALFSQVEGPAIREGSEPSSLLWRHDPRVF